MLEPAGSAVNGSGGNHPESSRTAQLFDRGVAKIAQKVGEEAVETLIEAVRGDKERLTEESADLLYHLLVLWADQGLPPAKVWKALAKRRETSKITEQAAAESAG